MKKNVYKQVYSALVSSILVMGCPTLAQAADPISFNNTYDTVRVDGSYADWDLVNDLSLEMHEAGQADKTHFSNAYLRYDCHSETMFVLVLDKDLPGGSVMDDGNYPAKQADNSWVKVDGFNGNMVDGRDDNGGVPVGSPPDFSWVAPDGVEQSTLVGWEGSFEIGPGNYSGIEIHVNMNGGDTSSTGKSGNRIPLNIQCSTVPPSEPDIEIEKYTNGVDADSAPGVMITDGGSVTWTYEVENTGNVDLSNVTVTDSDPGVTVDCDDDPNVVSNVISSLPVGASVTCRASDVASCPNANSEYSNIGYVTGDYNGDLVTDQDLSHYTCKPPSEPAPAISVKKSINGDDGLTLLVGQPVTWRFLVKNIGNVTLEDIVLFDNILGPIACPSDTLSVDTSMTCTVTGFAQAGLHENTGCVNGDYIVRDELGNETGRIPATEDCDPSDYFGADPKLDIEKRTQGFDADEPTGPFIEKGNTVYWRYSVKNTGNVTLENIEVTDDKGVTVICGEGESNIIPSLSPGESFNCNGTGIATVGQYANNGAADSSFTDDEGTPTDVHDDDDSHYFGAEPGIDIEKCTSDAALDACAENDPANHDDPFGAPLLEGDTVVWTYTITNTGNIVLDNVNVSDDQGVSLTCNGFSGTLDVGESITCTGSGSAVLGQYANNGCTSGNYEVIIDAEGNSETRTATDCDPSHYYGFSPQQPSIEVSVTDYSVTGDNNEFNSGTFVVENASGDVDALYLQDVSITIEYRVSGGNGWTDVPVDNNCDIDPDIPFVIEGPGEWVEQDARGQQEFTFSCTAEADQIPADYSSVRATVCVQLFNREDKVKGKYTGEQKWFCSSSDM